VQVYNPEGNGHFPIEQLL